MASVRSLVASTAIGIALAPLQSAFACSCVQPHPPLVELANHDAVFAGRVVDVVVSGQQAVARLEVLACWKGGVAGTVVVTTPASSAACGVGFEPGSEYLVYATDSAGLRASLCSRTGGLALAGEDLDALGAPGCVTAVAPGTWGGVKRLYTD
jgi:hypothetical protein